MSPVNVIVPTFERGSGLAPLLTALREQSASLPLALIVVDDGSVHAPPAPEVGVAPPETTVLNLRHAGATAARNAGAERATGETLVFIDDDIVPNPGTLARMVEALESSPRSIVLGVLQSRHEPVTAFARATRVAEEAKEVRDRAAASGDLVQVHFAHCMTGLLAIRTEDFRSLGGFQDPTGDWPNWDDVDFGYRAVQAGLSLQRHVGAIAEHHDHTLSDVAVAARRWRRASRALVRLFERHPQLRASIPMARDMAPVEWRADDAGLIGRKLLRRLSAQMPSRALLLGVIRLLERRRPQASMLVPLYRAYSGAEMCRGYREGLARARPGRSED